MNTTLTKKVAPSARERWLSLFLLALMALIAGLVLTLQSRYDVGQWRELENSVSQRLVDKPATLGADGLKPLSAGEQYDAGTLSDKINGKADLYLSAGFKQLETQRFGMSSDPGRWVERYIYLMDGFRNAFAVFSMQRRSDVEPLDLGLHAYSAGNGLFLVHGPYYLEIIAAEVSDQMRARAIDLARAFIAGHPVTSFPLTELALFPDNNQVPNSRILNAASVFGLEGLNWVYTNRYAANGEEATLFISRRASRSDASGLALAFNAYWRDYGGEAVVLPKNRLDFRTVTILDNFEIVWVQGDYLLGVHEATDLEFGLGLAEQLRQAVREGYHGPR